MFTMRTDFCFLNSPHSVGIPFCTLFVLHWSPFYPGLSDSSNEFVNIFNNQFHSASVALSFATLASPTLMGDLINDP